MARDPRYDILFEPVKIGPVTAKNRFYQVPHCNGMGHRYPRSLAAMRGMKAEGGWAVVCTEEVEIHPTSDIAPFNEGRLWDDTDIAYHALTVDAIHEHGALAGIELVHQGGETNNRLTRLPALAPSAGAYGAKGSVQARAMDKADIRALRGWYKEAAIRSKQAGYDIVYVYAGHSLSILQHFLSPKWNRRTDEYGGSLENRVRLLREVLNETKEAVGDTCGIALRFAVDEQMGPEGLTYDGEGRAIVEMLAELPDLWDVNISDWSYDSQTARFAPDEGYQDDFTHFVKQVTSKPVVGVGRYTSADGMVARVRKGHLDMIGSARPSIADPFLPNKIEEGRIEDIRECIGCNICVTGDNQMVPIRCTQNPTMGEEWRRGWHPEKIAPKVSDTSVLIVGSGPAGLECAHQLAKRGYPVTLAEAASEFGGRVTREAALPGLSSYGRVRDYRLGYLQQQSHVSLFAESALTAQDILQFGAQHVYLATGARWRSDGVGPNLRDGLPGRENLPHYSADDVIDGLPDEERIILWDDDNYYLGGVLAEKLADAGKAVSLVTAHPIVSSWTELTMEQERVQARLIEKGVTLIVSSRPKDVTKDGLIVACTFSDKERLIEGDAVVLVTERIANDQLYHALTSKPEDLEAAGIRTCQVIGDALVPGQVAQAVYSGHYTARRHETKGDDPAILRTERVAVLSE